MDVFTASYSADFSHFGVQQWVIGSKHPDGVAPFFQCTAQGQQKVLVDPLRPIVSQLPSALGSEIIGSYIGVDNHWGPDLPGLRVEPGVDPIGR